MLHRTETSVKNEVFVLAFFGTVFHFYAYVKQIVMLPVIIHMYTACTQVIKFGGVSVDVRNFSGGDEGSVDF